MGRPLGYVAEYEEAIRMREPLWGGHEGMWLCIRRPLGYVAEYEEAVRVREPLWGCHCGMQLCKEAITYLVLCGEAIRVYSCV